jgi:predicted nucleic acid-binding protein
VSRIYWDSMLFIYWLENNPLFSKKVAGIHTRMQQRQDQLITSAFTFGEVLAGAYRQGVPQLADEIRGLLLSVVSETVPFTVGAANHYARIRGTLGLSPADAVHLACAASAGTDLFLTNDKALVGKVIPGIQFIAGMDSNII